jgi:O-antigen/teichoic acid export membrane protein
MVERETPTVTPLTPETALAARRVALNAFSPFVAQVVTKVMMLGYIIVQFRLLGGGPLGDYFLAAIVFLYASTISDWGLGTLLTREVAGSWAMPNSDRAVEQQREKVAAMFGETLALRVLISLALFVPVGLFVLAYLAWFNLSMVGAWAILLLTLSLLPGAFSGTVTALLYAYERMSLPAVIGVATSAVNVALGVGALLIGWGVIGLAWAALVTTLLTAAVFWVVLRRDYPWLVIQSKAQGVKSKVWFGVFGRWTLLKAGWPLMLNALLVGLFFRVDTFVIEADAGSFDLERYQAAYSFLNFVLLITPAVTFALFPRMARHAVSDRARLAAEYTFALKALLVLSVPIIALTVWFAPLLITIVTGGKSGYLPNASFALQILIFFLPFSFINGVTQYVLIALDKQRLITRAFVATVLFNIAANLALVPRLGIYGAALTTVLSELVLLGPFVIWTQREVGPVSLASISLRPLAAGLVVAATGWLLWPLAEGWQRGLPSLAFYLGCGLALVVVYAAVLLIMRPFSQSERAAIRGALRRGE